MAGFIRGGSWLPVSFSSAAKVVSSDLVWHTKGHQYVPRKVYSLSGAATHLAINKLEDQSNFVPFRSFRFDLRSNPSLRNVRLPGSGPDIIVVRHAFQRERLEVEGSIRGTGSRESPAALWLITAIAGCTSPVMISRAESKGTSSDKVEIEHD